MTIQLLQKLSLQLGIGRSDLRHIIATAPKRYKVYPIAKRRGGTRTIAQPSRELKAIQRIVLREVLSKFPVHAAATGYAEGRSILHNAKAHAANPVILKLDFRNFFPSLVKEDWWHLLKSTDIGLDVDEIWWSTLILFWGQKSATPKCLSIGAPTSPALSNIILYQLDVQLAAVAALTGTTYTRYADDITASGEEIEHLIQFETMARSIVKSMSSPRLTFNDEKRGIYTSGQRRMVTGLVITPKGDISIGRHRKRLISAMIHHWSKNLLDDKAKAELKGLIAFCIASEPEFVSRLRAKYNSELIDSILRYHIVRRDKPRSAKTPNT